MNKYVSLSQAIKNAADLNTPSPDYFDNFLPAYKTYHKRQNVRRAVFKAIPIIAIFIVASFSYTSINNNKLDIDSFRSRDVKSSHTAW